jgi:lipopolysaccharide/colanic/teichoic acid biosynthesis glycosyltransferase
MAFNVPPAFSRSRRATAMAFVLPSPVPPPRRKHRLAGASRRPAEIVVSEPSTPLLAAKRAVDIAGAAFGLVVLSPLLLAVAVAIKATSPGPVLFRQKRHGYHNRRFFICKFRTMYADRGDAGGTHQTVSGDPRVTPIGRLLRKTSLDELPQLINVLTGDMSLVGPRPHVPGMLAGGLPYEHLLPYYFQRHTMRPGITGLAQVNGFRGSTSAPASAIDRLDCDLRYIQSWSLALDVSILARTIVREFLSGSGE